MNTNSMKKGIRFIFNTLCILIGLYPLIYFFIDKKFGLLALKSVELLTDNLWNISFYSHIVLGGIALSIGWIQFNDNIRSKKAKLHKLVGNIYIYFLF